MVAQTETGARMSSNANMQVLVMVRQNLEVILLECCTRVHMEKTCLEQSLSNWDFSNSFLLVLSPWQGACNPAHRVDTHSVQPRPRSSLIWKRHSIQSFVQFYGAVCRWCVYQKNSLVYSICWWKQPELNPYLRRSFTWVHCKKWYSSTLPSFTASLQPQLKWPW